MKWTWWKVLTIILVLYTVSVGLIIEVPRQPVLNETIRNLFYHVTMWFGMFILASISLFHSIQYLRKGKQKNDVKAHSYASVALLFGLLGLATGMIWVNYSWNLNPNKIILWVKEDIKLNAAAMGTLIYLVYFVLRQSVEEKDKKARFSAVYNIFAFVMLMLFTMVIPRMSSNSLHPGNAGNPGFNIYDVSDSMRLVFYPAIIGWSLLGYWLASLRVRITLLKSKTEL